MLFEIFAVAIVIIVFALLLYALSCLWEKLCEKLLKQISESETRRELLAWVMIYILFSVAIFIVEVFVIATVWEAIF